MISKRPDIELIENFFNRLNERGIDYCIMRNAQEVAEGDAHDVDMCIRGSRIQEAEPLLDKQAERLGWKLHLKTGSASDPSNIKCYNYYYADEEAQHIYIVHIDIFPTFAWKGYELIPNAILLENINQETIYHSIAPEAEAVCNLFVRLLYNGKIKDKYKPMVYQTFVIKKAEVCELMKNFLSEKLAETVYDRVIQQDWNAINAMRTRIVSDVKKHARRNLPEYVKYLLSKGLRRSGAIIAFQGTDGSGKTTIINGIEKTLGNTFSNDTLNYYHWRPGFVKSEKRRDAQGNVVSNVQPHTEQPYSKFISLVKLLVYTADYILGYWLKVYWQAAQGHLVVFDRYYYDFYMDKLRYRLNIGNWLIRLFHHIIPEPDMTFILSGEAQEIQARKNELSIEEVERQINCLHQHMQLFANPVKIDVCQSISRVVFSVSENILTLLSQKTQSHTKTRFEDD